MIIYDFFAGTGSSTQAFANAGHTVITFENDPSFDCTETVDIMELNAEQLVMRYGKPDLVWASPPCTAFSVASIGHHWDNTSGKPVPKTKAAAYNQLLVAKTIELVEQLQPTHGYLIENPRGMLRKLPVVEKLPRQTITYCQYGDSRMKPTDLWGGGRWMDTKEALQERRHLPRVCTERIENRHTRFEGCKAQVNDSTRVIGRNT